MLDVMYFHVTCNFVVMAFDCIQFFCKLLPAATTRTICY